MTLRLLFLCALCTVSTAWSQTPCSNTDPNVQEQPQGVALLENLKAKLLTVMTVSEANVIRPVRLCSPLSAGMLDITNVFALRRADTKVPIVVFGYSAQVALFEVGQALVIAQLAGIDKSYLDGFIRYRSTPLKFHSLPMTAREFAVQFGSLDTIKTIESMPESGIRESEMATEALLMFVLAHEFAHHVNGDIQFSNRLDAAQREAESQADKWATEKLSLLGINSIMAVKSMLLLNEFGNQTPSDTKHPTPLSRALAVVSESLSLAKSNSLASDQDHRLRSALPSIDSLIRVRDELEVRQNIDRRLQSDNVFLEKMAKQSTQARFELGRAYASGKRTGLRQDWKLARDWMDLAQANSAPYEYDFRVDAQVFAAQYNASLGGDLRYSCAMLSKAAFEKHGFAQALLNAAVRSKHCVIG